MKTEEQAMEQINEYTDLYYDLAFACYKLARQQGATIDESLNIAARKILAASEVAIAKRTPNK